VRPGCNADHSPPSSAAVKKEYSNTSTPPMGRTACTEPQCLYEGVLYLLPFTPGIEPGPSSPWPSPSTDYVSPSRLNLTKTFQPIYYLCIRPLFYVILSFFLLSHSLRARLPSSGVLCGLECRRTCVYHGNVS